MRHDVRMKPVSVSSAAPSRAARKRKTRDPVAASSGQTSLRWRLSRSLGRSAATHARMALRQLTMLCLGLTSVGGWQMTALPVPSGHAHCASSQASARQAVAPRMCSYDHLSSEFQARRRHPAPCGQPNPAATYRCPLAVAEAGEPAHGHGVWRASLVAAAAQGRERVGAALQPWRAERGRVHFAGP